MPLPEPIYALRASVRHTSANESTLSGWQTPTTRDWKGPSGRGYKMTSKDVPTMAALAREAIRLDNPPGLRRELREELHGQVPGEGSVERCVAGRLADADHQGPQGRGGVPECADQRTAGAGSLESGLENPGRPSEADCFWGTADWLFCRDGKWRPVEPGSFPLADGIPGRVGRLRGYGNAIVPQVAAVFIRAVMQAKRKTD